MFPHSLLHPFNIRIRGFVIYVGILGIFESAPGILTLMAPTDDKIVLIMKIPANSGSLVMVVSPVYTLISIDLV